MKISWKIMTSVLSAGGKKDFPNWIQEHPTELNNFEGILPC